MQYCDHTHWVWFLCGTNVLHLHFVMRFYCIRYMVHAKLIALAECNQNRMQFWKK